MGIQTFKCKKTKALFEGKRVLPFKAFDSIAINKLFMLHTANTLWSFKNPPSNHLEALKGNRMGQYSIRINRQWRLCFRWRGEHAYDVEIVDYH